MTRVFVYGTLMRGGGNHRLLVGSTFVGSATTVNGFRLFSCGGYPAMVRAPSGGGAVVGEVWEVEASVLARLDFLEGVDVGHYSREAIAVFVEGRKTPTAAQAYLQRLAQQRGRVEIHGGSWRGFLRR